MAVVLVFQDLHEWDNNIRGRKNYVKECDHNLNEIFRIIIDTKKRYPRDKIYGVFLGDVVHREFRNIDRAIYFYSRMTEIRSLLSDMFLVVGNHEITYSNNNPVWSLVKTIESDSAPIHHNFAKGRLPLLRIMDYIDIEGVRLHFIHHGSTSNRLGEGKNIAFVHDTFLCEPLINSMETKNDVDLKTEYTGYKPISDSSFLRFFDDIYFGHLHLAFGSYTVTFDCGRKTTLNYMGSLGRTNKDEVRITKNTRDIGLIRISEGDYTKDTLTFMLPEVEEVLDFEKVKKSEQAYEDAKERKIIRQTDLNGEDPVEKIENILSSNAKALEIFRGSKRGEMPEWLIEVL